MIEVLKQMVEALETAWTYDEDNADGYYFEAIQAGKQAISELEQRSIAEVESQEPVAWCIWFCGGIVGFFDKQDEAIEEFRQRNQEYPDESRKLVPLYTAPPQRTWVGLTDEEAQWLYDNCRTPSNLIDMVEAKLKEKNT